MALARRIGEGLQAAALIALLAAGCAPTATDDTDASAPPTTAPALTTAAAAATVAPAPPAPESAPKPAEPPPGPRFVEVGQEVGMTGVILAGGARKDHLLESTGTGCVWLDYDDDGDWDAYVVNSWRLDEEPSRVAEKGRNFLYRNNGDGTFTDVAREAGVDDDGWGCGACAADADNDGDVDLYVTNFGPNVFYRNNGDGTFKNDTETAGLTDPEWGAGAAFFDADNDGDLDLYVANYVQATVDDVLAARRSTTWRESVKVMVGPFGLRGGRDHFYRNNGDGTFTDATDAAGMTDLSESYGLGVVVSDLDDDGDPDVYVANDSNPNFLYRNDGDGTFTDVGSWSGAGLSGEGAAQAGMGVEAADFHGDGLVDLFVTNFAQDSATLYRNLGGMFFEDVSVPLKLKAITYDALKWGCALFDADHDGDGELMIANGHIYPQVDEAPHLNESYRQTPLLMHVKPDQMIDVSAQAGPAFAVKASARGLAVADYDDDGDLDVLLTQMDGPPLLFRNETPPAGRHSLRLRLLNPHGTPAFGARATVTAGGRAQLRELRAGSSYQSQHAPELHFGLGPADKADSITIRWPNGQTTTLKNVPADRVETVPAPAK